MCVGIRTLQAAALVAYDTINRAGQRLLDVKMLNMVLVLMLTTAVLGPVLTERFAPLNCCVRRHRQNRLKHRRSTHLP